MSTCPRCGEAGPHFVPPSLGDTGFFMCDPNDRPKPSRTPENYVMPCVLCPAHIMPGDEWVARQYGEFTHKACAERVA